MQRYIGVKEINAKSMTRLEYNQFRGWDLPSNENGDEKGFLVEYIDGGQPNTAEYKGYVSWSPKDVFERAYHPVVGLSFGLAIELLKKGKKVARKGWNGKGIFIELQVPDTNSKMSHPYIFIDTTGLISDNENAKRNLVPWLASQTDMLSEDWEIVE